MRNRTYPKENEKKLKQDIRELKSRILQLEKENKFLHKELTNLVKPTRERKPHQDRSKFSHDEWRKDFIARFKREVLDKED